MPATSMSTSMLVLAESIESCDTRLPSNALEYTAQRSRYENRRSPIISAALKMWRKFRRILSWVRDAMLAVTGLLPAPNGSWCCDASSRILERRSYPLEFDVGSSASKRATLYSPAIGPDSESVVSGRTSSSEHSSRNTTRSWATCSPDRLRLPLRKKDHGSPESERMHHRSLGSLRGSWPKGCASQRGSSQMRV